MFKKLTINDVELFVAENSSCKLISDHYVNSKEKLKFECACGNEFEVAFDAFRTAKQRQCPSCGFEIRARKRRESLDSVVRFFGNNGLKLLSKEYVNARTKLLAMDEDGYKILISLDNLKKGQAPQRFYQNNPHSIENVKLWLKQNNCNFDIISKVFISSSDGLKFKCNKGHAFETSWNKIQSQRAGCPTCYKSKGEDVISSYLDNNGIDYETQKTFAGCTYKKQLRFDFYIESLNTCIEFQGAQHYKPVKIFGGDRRFEAQQRKDSIKAEFCKNNNIRLIEISYKEIDNINKILKGTL